MKNTQQMKKEDETVAVQRSLQVIEEELRNHKKPFYKTKTLWFNTALLLTTISTDIFQWYLANPGATLTLAAFINIFLRFRTKHELVPKTPQKP